MITLKEFTKKICEPRAAPYLLICDDVVVFDRAAQVAYIPVTTHAGAKLNPMGDFRTKFGHGLLWSRHIEVDCSSDDMRRAVGIFEAIPQAKTHEYAVYRLSTPRK